MTILKGGEKMAANQAKNGKAWVNLNNDQLKTVDEFNRGYLEFLNRVKTEREAVKFIEEIALSQGFKPLEQSETIEPGTRILISMKNKVAALFIAGKRPLSD